MVNVKGGIARIGDKVLVNQVSGNPRLAIFESLYNGKMNCRFIDDGDMDTVDSVNVSIPSLNQLENYYNNMSVKDLQNELNMLRPRFDKLGYEVVVQKKKEVEVKEPENQ